MGRSAVRGGGLSRTITRAAAHIEEWGAGARVGALLGRLLFSGPELELTPGGSAWWNFVARADEEFRQAYEDWVTGSRCGEVKRYAGGRLDAPEIPETRPKACGRVC
ncbi:hypothetical protein SVEN_0672 [Streptomyces venezuelae ATCC 10712]|uniref:Uncharacterized protein n=1 Tax=Streptomyces venezuelae (strain ATCC 10712 / CBS 650.69 / DSM 40230 / JCM 4526 / NBRC 13096 / PD 04745) TaxID=953739 RepID=F2R8P1_STRVP|nr:hypothetical protein SVEN_0672 [Streptomyces venezuelae ATCC 10712]